MSESGDNVRICVDIKDRNEAIYSNRTILSNDQSGWRIEKRVIATSIFLYISQKRLRDKTSGNYETLYLCFSYLLKKKYNFLPGKRIVENILFIVNCYVDL